MPRRSPACHRGARGLIEPPADLVASVQRLLRYFTGARIRSLLDSGRAGSPDVATTKTLRTYARVLQQGGVWFDVDAEKASGTPAWGHTAYEGLVVDGAAVGLPLSVHLRWNGRNAPALAWHKRDWYGKSEVHFVLSSLATRGQFEAAPLQLDRIKADLDFALSVVPHELTHATQYTLAPWAAAGRGVPGARHYPGRQRPDVHGGVDDAAGRARHALRPVEFYPRLVDEVERAVDELTKLRWDVRGIRLQRLLGAGGRYGAPPALDTLRELKDAGHDKLYRKAVGLVYAAVAERVPLTNPAAEARWVRRPSATGAGGRLDVSPWRFSTGAADDPYVEQVATRAWLEAVGAEAAGVTPRDVRRAAVAATFIPRAQAEFRRWRASLTPRERWLHNEWIRKATGKKPPDRRKAR